MDGTPRTTDTVGHLTHDGLPHCLARFLPGVHMTGMTIAFVVITGDNIRPSAGNAASLADGSQISAFRQGRMRLAAEAASYRVAGIQTHCSHVALAW
jgi:hypothetical protein